MPRYSRSVAHYLHRAMIKTVAGGPSESWADVEGRRELWPNEMFDPIDWATWTWTYIALDNMGLSPMFISTTSQQHKPSNKDLQALFRQAAQHPSYNAYSIYRGSTISDCWTRNRHKTPSMYQQSTSLYNPRPIRCWKRSGKSYGTGSQIVLGPPPFPSTMRRRMVQCLMDSMNRDETMAHRISAFVDPLTAKDKKVTLMFLSEVPLPSEGSIS